MKFLVINGPNLNLLGLREPAIYGSQSFAALQDFIRASAAEAGVEVAGYYSAAPSGEAELVLVVSGGGNEALCVLGGRFGEEEALRLATMQREQLLGRGGTR